MTQPVFKSPMPVVVNRNELQQVIINALVDEIAAKTSADVLDAVTAGYVTGLGKAIRIVQGEYVK